MDRAVVIWLGSNLILRLSTTLSGEKREKCFGSLLK